jgi:hypothetical protein
MAKRKEKAWTKEIIKAGLVGSDRFLMASLIKVYENQTTEEQNWGSVHIHNGVGFTRPDAEFLTSLAQQFQRRGNLSERQMHYLREKMGKYANQLAKQANALGIPRQRMDEEVAA